MHHKDLLILVKLGHGPFVWRWTFKTPRFYGYQATTTAQHTLRLEAFEGETYEGALLYVALSVNTFAFQSIEEVDPVDWWALLGSAGGMWGK